MQATGVTQQTAIVDLGYRGVDKDNQNLNVNHRGKFKSMAERKKTAQTATSH
jgi:transposase, IS5 family